jgi:hypothetical protein
MHKVYGIDIKEIVDRKDWQELRENFLGTWKRYPEDNVRSLREWLGPICCTQADQLVIVLNYLTGSAFRLSIIYHKDINDLKEDIVREIKSRKEFYFGVALRKSINERRKESQKYKPILKGGEYGIENS